MSIKGRVREGAAHSSFQNAPHTHLPASLSRRSRNFKYFSSQSYALDGVCKSISPPFTPITTSLYSGTWPPCPKSEEASWSVAASGTTSVSRRWHTDAPGQIWPNANNFHMQEFSPVLQSYFGLISCKGSLSSKSWMPSLEVFSFTVYSPTSEKSHLNRCSDWATSEGAERQKVSRLEARKRPRLLLQLERQHHEHALVLSFTIPLWAMS